jgi:hypothetical protein
MTTPREMAEAAVFNAIFGRTVEAPPPLTTENVLSLFDPPPNPGEIATPDGEILYEGPRLTVQHVATYFNVSDSTARRALRKLEKRGPVTIFKVFDPGMHKHRLLITPKAT